MAQSEVEKLCDFLINGQVAWYLTTWWMQFHKQASPFSGTNLGQKVHRRCPCDGLPVDFRYDSQNYRDLNSNLAPIDTSLVPGVQVSLYWVEYPPSASREQ